MTGWLLQDAAGWPAAPAYAAVADVGHDQVIVWTQNPSEALSFGSIGEARQFAREHVTRAVRVFALVADEVDHWQAGEAETLELLHG